MLDRCSGRRSMMLRHVTARSLGGERRKRFCGISISIVRKNADKPEERFSGSHYHRGSVTYHLRDKMKLTSTNAP